MRENLYLSIKRFSLLNSYYFFFDTRPYLADQIFINHEVRVWFDQEYSREDTPYVAILCHVRKKDMPRFIAAMEDLKRKMVLCGHPDYVDRVGSYLDELESAKGKGFENESDASGKTE